MIKADDKVVYDEEHPEKYSNFEKALIEIELLKEQLNEMAAILRANNLTRTEEIEAPYFDDDELFDRLEEDYEDEPKPETKTDSKKE